MSENSDEETRLQAVRMRHPRRIFIRKNPFKLYDDVDFTKRWRIKENTLIQLLNLIGHQHHLEPALKRNHFIYAKLQLLHTLRFLANASFQQVFGDNRTILTFINLWWVESLPRSVLFVVTDDVPLCSIMGLSCMLPTKNYHTTQYKSQQNQKLKLR